MQILAISGAVNTMATFDRSLLLAAGEPRAAFRLQGGQTVLGLVLVVVALPFGIVGVAVARAVRQVAYWPIRLRVLAKRLGLDVRGYVRKVAPPLGVCAVLFGTVGALQWTPWPDVTPVVAFLAPAGLATVALYLAGMHLVAPDDVRDLWRVVTDVRARRSQRAAA
jgi:PST family polysaccharide transporter